MLRLVGFVLNLFVYLPTKFPQPLLRAVANRIHHNITIVLGKINEKRRLLKYSLESTSYCLNIFVSTAALNRPDRLENSKICVKKNK